MPIGFFVNCEMTVLFSAYHPQKSTKEAWCADVLHRISNVVISDVVFQEKKMTKAHTGFAKRANNTDFAHISECQKLFIFVRSTCKHKEQ